MEILNIANLGAVCLGFVLGYTFSWAIRRLPPGASEIIALTGVILGGGAMTVIKQLQSANALPIYLVGLAIGYVAYLIMLKLNWTKVQDKMKHGRLSFPPPFPWVDDDSAETPKNK